MEDFDRLTRRQWFAGLTAPLAVLLSGCGTLMHPEREGQPRTGRLDWTVVGMDAIGLLFFFVPGVIAFAIDFYNGTIFFPPEYAFLKQTPSRGLKSVALTRKDPDLTEVSAVLSRELGRPIELVEGQYLVREMESLDEFWGFERRLAALSVQDESIGRCQSP